MIDIFSIITTENYLHYFLAFLLYSVYTNMYKYLNFSALIWKEI